MSGLLRFVASFAGGMLAAAGLILFYVYVLGAPDLPRLPIIGLPSAHVAIVLIAVWSVPQVYLSVVGLFCDGILAGVGWRARPGVLLALFHGAVATAALLALWFWYRPSLWSVKALLAAPLAINAALRLVAGRLPPPPSRD